MDTAFLGAGLMGAPMAKRLLDAGHKVSVYNRTLSKTRPLADAGAAVAGSPQEAVESAQCVITMLTDAGAIEEVVLNNPVLSALEGRILIQMSTIAPSESEDIMARVTEAGAEYMESPVLGSTPQAEQGRLILMVGSTPGQFDEWRGFIEAFGPDPVYAGEVPGAAVLKLALNQLIASFMSAFSLSYGLVRKSGVDTDKFMEVFRRSPLYVKSLEGKLESIRARDFTNVHFPAKHLLKDVELLLKAAGDTDLDTGALQGVRKIIEKTVAGELGDLDYSALYNLVDPQ